MNKLTAILFFSTAILFCQTELFAQSKITFQVNLKPQLEDSLFIPDRGDFVEVSGDVYPLNMNGNRLFDQARDSIYTISVEFSRSDLNKTIHYNFVLHTDGEQLHESMPRSVRVEPGEIELDALYFDAFAW